MNRVTLEHIARRVGKSKACVSLALRNRPGVSEKVRQEVLRVAEELRYRPDPTLSAIAACRWRSFPRSSRASLAFIWDSRNPGVYCTAFRDATREFAVANGYAFDSYDVSEYASPESLSRILYARGVRGLVVSSVMQQNEFLQDLDWSRFTAVSLGSGFVFLKIDTVTFDFFQLTREAWELAHRAGYRRIGAALYSHRSPAEFDYHRIGASYATRHYLGIPRRDWIPFLLCDHADEAALLDWYHEHKPEIIIAFNPSSAGRLERAGIRIPDDVAMLVLELTTKERLSGFVVDPGLVAEAGTEMLVESIKRNEWGIPENQRVVQLEPHFHPGETMRVPEGFAPEPAVSEPA